ncbi:MAG: thiol peroxidase [Salibacteraceae bacterium]
MATITFKGDQITTTGSLPKSGEAAPKFTLTNDSMQDITLDDFKGQKLVLNIFPSIDTGICAMSARRFNQEASGMENTTILNVSKDLPFAQKRFCGAEGLEDVKNASEFKNTGFSSNYHVIMESGPLAGLFSRAVVIIDESGKVVYTEQVPEIVQEPNYEKALAALK